MLRVSKMIRAVLLEKMVVQDQGNLAFQLFYKAW